MLHLKDNANRGAAVAGINLSVWFLTPCGVIMKYWNIFEILPYQRCFNFINGKRSIGKTYTTQKYTLKKCIDLNLEFIYIVRTQDEKEKGVLSQAYEKVCQNEFKNDSFKFTNEEMYIQKEGHLQILGYCIALSEAQKIKKRSFPNVKYLIFDEYMLENNSRTRYVNGWREPDLLLSIYHTADREEDRIICFLLGNTTTFYNPYHMHPAFNIPLIEQGEIWTSENVLFQWAKASEELEEEKSKSKFVRMINASKYGKYAAKGEYIEDKQEFIEARNPSARHNFNIEYNGIKYGVWNDLKHGKIYIDSKYDESCRLNYALTLDDHSENTMLTNTKNVTCLAWLSKNFKIGNVRYTSMEVKKMVEPAIQLIL